MRGADNGAEPHKHRIPTAQLEELCAGGGGPAVVRTLWSGQRSRRLLLIDIVVSQALSGPGVMGPLPPPSSGWNALKAADRVVSEDCSRLLLHPQVGSWAAYVLRRARGRVSADAPFWVDAGVLHTLALIANTRAGLSFTTALPARDGNVMLPTLGMARFPGLPRWGFVAATTAGGRIRLRSGDIELAVPVDPAREVPGWWPLRRLSAGEDVRLSVFLDDLDPFRELADPVGPERLDGASAGRWSDLLKRAWGLLCQGHRETAEALAAGLVCIVPLPSDGTRTSRSASTGEAFGSLMTSPPIDEVDLAVTLVHEFQHIKLGGLAHFSALTEERDQPALYAPWRDDPRPLPGLMQGIFAFFGIADFWRVRRHAVTGSERLIADFEFAYARGQVETALRQVTGAPGLTDMGRRLVAGLTGRLDSWRNEATDAGMGALAALLGAGHQAEWRLRHLSPDGSRIAALADRWSGLDGTGRAALPVSVEPDARPRWSLDWQRRIREYAYRGKDAAHGAPADGDAALLAGDEGAARAAYTQAIVVDPGDAHAWAGLSLTAAAGEPLRTHPEVVRAVHAVLRSRGLDIDPESVSEGLVGAARSLESSGN
jgi:HEXXH motif-containing protein